MNIITDYTVYPASDCCDVSLCCYISVISTQQNITNTLYFVGCLQLEIASVKMLMNNAMMTPRHAVLTKKYSKTCIIQVQITRLAAVAVKCFFKSAQDLGCSSGICSAPVTSNWLMQKYSKSAVKDWKLVGLFAGKHRQHISRVLSRLSLIMKFI